MRTQWNDEEDEALLSVPWRARVVYLQGIRRRMDLRTGLAGLSCVVSYQQLSEVLDCTERSTKPDPRVDKEGLRAIFKMLERASLVDWIKEDRGQKGLLFFLKLADRDYQHQKQDNPKTTPRQPQEDNPENASNINEEKPHDNPKATPRHSEQDNPPPVSGDPEDRDPATHRERETPQRTARGARLSLSVIPGDWSDWARRERPDLDVGATWEKFRDHWIAQAGAGALKADWFATWRTWVRRERGNGNGRATPHRESAVERFHRINRADYERHAGGDPSANGRIIDGEVVRVAGG